VRIAFAGAIWLGAVSVVFAGAQAEERTQMAEDLLSNVQILRGIPVDEFMEAMGMFTAALGVDCTACHSPDIVSDRALFAQSTPRIETARRMVLMTRALNAENFGGAPRITCFTCHGGQLVPSDVPNLALQYGAPLNDPNAMRLIPLRGTSAEEVLDEYLQAIGGPQQAGRLTSFVARGTYAGFDTGFVEMPIEIFASAPDRRTTVVELFDGVRVKVYDGQSGWLTGPNTPLPVTSLSGGNLMGARLEAMAPFPIAFTAAFDEWQVGRAVIDDRTVRVLQGRSPGQLPVNLYFDDSGQLVRLVRWSETVVGRIPTQVDYDDYRSVAGVSMPFRWIETWTNGQTTIQLSDVQANVVIDPSRFSRPVP
jgi:photosynthetic reaction center cytochrome c subunit